MSMKVAVIGECMIELSEGKTGIVRHFGGDTLNTAIYLTRSNPDLAVHYVTALGTDIMSSTMLVQWQQEGVQTDMVQCLDQKLPGLYLIETDEQGERTFYYWRNDAAARYWLQGPNTDQICNSLLAYDYIYLSGISLAILSPDDRIRLLKLLTNCRTAGVKIAFDNNYRPRLWESVSVAQDAYRSILSLTDIAFLTLDDELTLWGDNQVEQTLARTQALGVNEIIIKRGPNPCLTVQGAIIETVPAVLLEENNIVDTTAAGDAFSAGYLARRLTGQSTRDSAHYAHQLASTVIQYRGAIIPLSAMPITVTL